MLNLMERQLERIAKLNNVGYTTFLTTKVPLWWIRFYICDERWLRFSFPTSWHYDVLRGLDYLRNAGIKPDLRVREAIKIVITAGTRTAVGRPICFMPNAFLLEMKTAVGRYR